VGEADMVGTGRDVEVMAVVGAAEIMVEDARAAAVTAVAVEEAEDIEAAETVTGTDQGRRWVDKAITKKRPAIVSFVIFTTAMLC